LEEEDVVARRGEKIIAAPGRGDDLLLPAAMKILLAPRELAA
jgi:hypothetical protein